MRERDGAKGGQRLFELVPKCFKKCKSSRRWRESNNKNWIHSHLFFQRWEKTTLEEQKIAKNKIRIGGLIFLREPNDQLTKMEAPKISYFYKATKRKNKS